MDAKPAVTEPASDQHNTKVLLIEDDPISRALVGTMLVGSGYEIVEAHDGESARRTVGWEADFDCILLDLELPDCDGLDLLAELRMRPELREIPVVVVTARSDPEAIRRGLAAGAYYYLTKPIRPGLLAAIVGAAAESRREFVAQPALGPAVIRLLDRGEFALTTINQARALAEALAELCPDPKAARGALQELLVNAIEHGNLEIDYATKTELMLEDRWQDEIDQRLQNPRFRDRSVKVAFRRDGQMLECVISDSGPGFDWQPYLELSEERAFDPNGRGIAIAAQQVDELIYSGRGNVVTVRYQLKGA